MKALGIHPFFVEQQKATYKRVEARKSEILYKAWKMILKVNAMTTISDNCLFS